MSHFCHIVSWRPNYGTNNFYLTRQKAKNLDKNISGTSDQGRGPVGRRLDEFGQIIGLCFGAWGEGSDDVHSLV